MTLAARVPAGVACGHLPQPGPCIDVPCTPPSHDPWQPLALGLPWAGLFQNVTELESYSGFFQTGFLQTGFLKPFVFKVPSRPVTATFCFVLNYSPLPGWTTVYPSPSEGHRGCFQLFTIMNKAATNCGV